MVKRLSDYIASYISNELNYNQDKGEVMSYGLEIIIGGFLKTISLITLSLVLGIFSYTMVGMVSFAVFRTIIGGAHQDTYGKCFVTSITILLCIGALGKNFYFVADSSIWAFLVYGQSFFSTLTWVPAGTEKKEIKNQKLRIKMKSMSIALLTLWIILIILYPIYNYQQYVFSSILGVFTAFFLITPLAYKLMSIKFNFKKGVI